MIFIDSNIPMYVAGGDHPNKEPSQQLLTAVVRGEVEARTSTEVLQEILYRYHALGKPELARKVYDYFVEVCPGVLEVTLADTDRAAAILASDHSVGVRDAIHAGVMLNHGIEEIASFDEAFDRIEGVRRFLLV